MILVGELRGSGKSDYELASIYQRSDGQIYVLWNWGKEKTFEDNEEFQKWLKTKKYISEVKMY